MVTLDILGWTPLQNISNWIQEIIDIISSIAAGIGYFLDSIRTYLSYLWEFPTHIATIVDFIPAFLLVPFLIFIGIAVIQAINPL